MNRNPKLRLNVVFTSAAVGPGLRTAVFFQGCTGPIGRARREVLADGSRDGHCVGCHARRFWPRDGGWEADPVDLARAIMTAGRDVSLLGGEPLLQADALRHFLWEVKKNTDAPEIAIYSGSYFEDLVAIADHSPALWDCLAMVDILVDGPFRQHLDDDGIQWRGSRNQRAIDVQMSIAFGEVVPARGWEGGLTILPDGRVVAAAADARALATWGLGEHDHYHACGAIR